MDRNVLIGEIARMMDVPREMAEQFVRGILRDRAEDPFEVLGFTTAIGLAYNTGAKHHI